MKTLDMIYQEYKVEIKTNNLKVTEREIQNLASRLWDELEGQKLTNVEIANHITMMTRRAFKEIAKEINN